MRRAFVWIALLLAGCEETIVLGTECPSRNGACSTRPPVGDDKDADGSLSENEGGKDPADPGLDGGIDVPGRDAGRRDAGGGDRDASVNPGRDAHVPEDAGPALFPPFRNPSFELVDGGTTGPLAVTMPGATSPTETSIAPWYAYNCFTGIEVNTSASYGGLGNQTMVAPADGNTFVTNRLGLVAINLTGITQELAEPLLPATHYAFAVEVYAQRDFPFAQISEFVLDLTSADILNCVPGRKLASSEPVVPDGWRKLCMRFTTPEASPLQPPIRSVMLITTPQDPVNFSAVHIDNIRPDPECGNVVK